METTSVSDHDSAVASNVQCIVLPTSQGTMIIPIQQIIRIQSISNYSKLFFSNGKTLVVAKVLRWFEGHTSLLSFVRIHRTHFVNMRYIQSYRGGKIGLLYLHNGEMFSVAKRKKAVLSERLNGLSNTYSNEVVSTSSTNIKKILAA